MKLMGTRGAVQHFLLDGEGRLMASSLRLYRRQLTLVMGYLGAQGVQELEAVTVGDLREFVRMLSQTEENTVLYPQARRRVHRRPAPATVASYVRVIRAFFAWCVDEELIEKSPAARLSLPKLPRRVIKTFAPEQIEQLLAACDVRTGQGFRDYVILVVLLDTGMRVSELVDLRVGNVYTRHVKVLGKGFKEREIGLHPDVSKLLWVYIEKYRPSGAYPGEDRVFLGRKGALTTEGIEQVFQRAARVSGIEGVRVTPHTMRHTFSKWYLKNGGDLFRLSRELGHSDVQVTGRVYLGDYTSSDAREEHAKYSPIAGLGIVKQVSSGRGPNKHR